MCIGIMAMCALIWFVPLEQSLQHDGRPISYWFSQLPATVATTQGVMYCESVTLDGRKYGRTTHDGALKALSAPDPNVLPYLLRKIQSSDSRYKRFANRWALRVGFGVGPFRDPGIERSQAVTALVHMEHLPPKTLAALRALTTDARPEVAQAAACVLRIRTETNDAPAFRVQSLTIQSVQGRPRTR